MADPRASSFDDPAVPARPWGARAWILVLACGIAVSITTFLLLHASERRRAEVDFASQAEDRLATLGTNISLSVDKLRAVGAYFDASGAIDRSQMRRLSAPLLADDRAIQALEWIPRVEAAQRADYEEQLRREGVAVNEIRERTSTGQMVRAGEREVYYPVDFVEPLAGNERAQQFDLASNPARREALQRAASSGQMVSTARIVLVQETGDQYGFLLFRPVYRTGGAAAPAQALEESVAGFALGVFRLGDMLGGADRYSGRSDIGVALFDLSAKPGERLLFPKGQSERWDSIDDIRADHKVFKNLQIGGRDWMSVAYSMPSASPFPVEWQSLAALLGGLLLSTLLAAYLRLGSKQREQIELMVAERTEDLERAQEQLLLAKDAAEAGSRAKSNFLATVSHELRTPMNGVIGYAELLLMPEVTVEDRNSYANTILTSSRMLLTLLDDILDLSKIEAGKMQLMASVVDIEVTFEELVKIFGPVAGRKKLQLQSRWEGPEHARYLGDPIRLRQILANLINNAIKFTESGSVEVVGRELDRDPEGAMLEFTVTDTGVGISDENIARLFKPFSQVGEFGQAKTTGTGLGLSIVQKLARMMGGDAMVESRLGEGSCFWVRVRVRHAPPPRTNFGRTVGLAVNTELGVPER